jgi:hypothetical protein
VASKEGNPQAAASRAVALRLRLVGKSSAEDGAVHSQVERGAWRPRNNFQAIETCSQRSGRGVAGLRILEVKGRSRGRQSKREERGSPRSPGRTPSWLPSQTSLVLRHRLHAVKVAGLSVVRSHQGPVGAFIHRP